MSTTLSATHLGSEFKRVTACLLLVLSAILSAKADTSQDVALALQDKGFENVKSAIIGDTIFAAIENSNYRGSYRSIGVALQTLSEAAPQYAVFKLLVLEYKQPRIVVTTQKDQQQWNVRVDYDVKSAATTIQSDGGKEYANSYGKIDITPYPIVFFSNHRQDVLALVGVFVAPSFETTLWKGNRITLQPIIPVWNNFPRRNLDRRVQLGVLSIRQDWLTSNKWEVSTTAGTFLYNTIGLHLDANYHVNRRLDLGIRTGLTREQFFTSEGWNIKKKNNLMGMLNISYYEPYSSMQFKISAGRFLYGDYGFRGDIVRHYGEYAIGAYVAYADRQHNAGFNFAIPLGKKKQIRKSLFRVRLPQYFSWEYAMINWDANMLKANSAELKAQRAKGYGWEEAQTRKMKDYKERPEKSFTNHYWQAEYIQQYLQRYMNGLIE